MIATDLKDRVIAVIPNEKGNKRYFITESTDGHVLTTYIVSSLSTGGGINIFSDCNYNIVDFIKRKPKSFFKNLKSFIRRA